MADAVTTQVYDSVRNYVITANDISDGTGLNLVTLVDVSTMTPNPGEHLVLWRADYDVGDVGGVTLYWEGTPNRVLLAMEPGGVDRYVGTFGGLRNDALTPTGNILISTHGFVAGSTFSLTLEFKKGGVVGFNT